jgi:chromosome segregation ATPase
MEGRTYGFRDHKGKFTKGVQPMTIDHDTNLPVNLNLCEDESMIRQTLGKFADGIVKLSQFAKRIEELESALGSLESRLGEATVARDKAIEDAAVARHDAEMASQAYDTANAKRIRIEADLSLAQENYKSLLAANNKLLTDYSFQEDEVSRSRNLLSHATEERDHYRKAESDLKFRLEDAEFKNLELEETKENLDITKLALNECASKVADWKAKASEFEMLLHSVNLERNSLNRKANDLEGRVRELAETNLIMQDRLDTIRRTIEA